MPPQLEQLVPMPMHSVLRDSTPTKSFLPVLDELSLYTAKPRNLVAVSAVAFAACCLYKWNSQAWEQPLDPRLISLVTAPSGCRVRSYDDPLSYM